MILKRMEEGDDGFMGIMNDWSKFSSDDDEDDVYKPDEVSDDDDEALDDSQDAGPSQCAVDLTKIFKRFEDKTHLPDNQVFLTPFPSISQLSGSPMTVAQWDQLRHQCRLHFGLLCRSISFVAYCSSSDTILNGLLTMIHSFHELFLSSVECCSNVNTLFGRSLFIPVMGDPKKSMIRYSREILDRFLQGATVDEVLELPIFTEIFEVFPFGGENRPRVFATHFPWTVEENSLCEVAARRFHSPEEVQKFVMPGRSVAVIESHFRGEWRRKEVIPEKPRRRRGMDEVARQAAAVEHEDPELPFQVKDGMKFAQAELPI
jgi:hypothetical protein